jgi:hypothetical protein
VRKEGGLVPGASASDRERRASQVQGRPPPSWPPPALVGCLRHIERSRIGKGQSPDRSGWRPTGCSRTNWGRPSSRTPTTTPGRRC